MIELTKKQIKRIKIEKAFLLVTDYLSIHVYVCIDHDLKAFKNAFESELDIETIEYIFIEKYQDTLEYIMSIENSYKHDNIEYELTDIKKYLDILSVQKTKIDSVIDVSLFDSNYQSD